MFKVAIKRLLLHLFLGVFFLSGCGSQPTTPRPQDQAVRHADEPGELRPSASVGDAEKQHPVNKASYEPSPSTIPEDTPLVTPVSLPEQSGDPQKPYSDPIEEQNDKGEDDAASNPINDQPVEITTPEASLGGDPPSSVEPSPEAVNRTSVEWNMLHLISGNWGYALVIMDNGSLLACGNNEYGQLGNGETGDGDDDTLDCYSDTPIMSLDNVKSVSALYQTALALKKDDTLWAWGKSGIPSNVMSDVKYVATGHGLHCLVVKNDNTLWGWGWNGHGQLGDGTTQNKDKPAKLMDDVQCTSVGYGYSMIVKTDGSLWAVGLNTYGALGDGTKVTRNQPVKIMEDVRMVASAQLESYAVKKDGSLWAWGSNMNGGVGDGTKVSRLKPVKVMEDVTYVSTNIIGHVLALKKDGTLWSWGKNNCGQVGDGTVVDRLSPCKVLTNVKAIAAGLNFSMAVKNDNALWAWGLNDSGQLAVGDRDNRLKPTLVMDLSKKGAP